MTAAISPADRAQLQALEATGRAMIEHVARTGSGNYAEPVEVYQKTWNASRSSIEAVGKELWRKLAEDGKYGPNTAWTLAHLVRGPIPPKRAYQVPTWYAQNRDVVSQMGNYTPPPATAATTPSPAYVPDPIPVPVVSAKTDLPGVPAAVPPPPAPPVVVPPAPSPIAPVEIPSSERELTPPGSEIVVVGKSASPLPPSPEPEPQELPPLEVYGKVPKGDAPFIAAVVGGTALAGVLAYWLYRRRAA